MLFFKGLQRVSSHPESSKFLLFSQKETSWRNKILLSTLAFYEKSQGFFEYSTVHIDVKTKFVKKYCEVVTMLWRFLA